MCRIGILGGTFDPIHNGHIALAAAAYEQFDLDKILVMVSKKPPHKKTRIITDDIHRSNMVRLAIKDYPYMEFSDFELKREGYIYTADTLLLLEKEHPDNKYYFILGGDSLRDLNKWYHPEIVLKKAVILAAFRDNIKEQVYKEIVSELTKDFKDSHPDIRMLKIKPLDISSSIIREGFYQDNNILSYMNKDVEKYIIENRLYT